MPNPKILVVDDDPDLVRALRLRLRANNYDVTTACDGYAAIAAAQWVARHGFASLVERGARMGPPGCLARFARPGLFQ